MAENSDKADIGLATRLLSTVDDSFLRKVLCIRPFLFPTNALYVLKGHLFVRLKAA